MKESWFQGSPLWHELAHSTQALLDHPLDTDHVSQKKDEWLTQIEMVLHENSFSPSMTTYSSIF